MIDQAVLYQSFLNYETEAGAEQPGLFQASITDIANIIVIFDYHLIGNLKENVLVTNYLDVLKKGPIYDLLKRNWAPLQSKIHKYLQREFPDNGRDSYWNLIVESTAKECLSRLLLRIQNYHHGGAILITPGTSGLSIKYKIAYSRLQKCIIDLSKLTVAHTYYSDKIHGEYLEKDSELMPTELYLDDNVSGFEKDECRDELKGVIRFISSLSCVDGLIAIDNAFNIFGFGAVIQTKNLPEKIYVSTTLVINEDKLTTVDPSYFGTRHRSVFSYCWKHKGSIGFIISQDGDIRAVTKVNTKLIMWENIKVFYHSVTYTNHSIRRTGNPGGRLNYSICLCGYNSCPAGDAGATHSNPYSRFST